MKTIKINNSEIQSRLDPFFYLEKDVNIKKYILLQDIAYINKGSFNNFEEEKKIKVLSPACIQEYNKIDLSNVKFTYDIKDELILQKNDIIFPSMAQKFKIHYFLQHNEKITINNHLFLLRFNEEKYLSWFMYYLFQSQIIQLQLKRLLYGVIPEIKLVDLKMIKIPVVSLEKQNLYIDFFKNAEREKIDYERKANEVLEKIFTKFEKEIVYA